MPKKSKEVSGRFGKLTVIHCNLPPRKRVLVRCDCGKEFATKAYDLLNGRTKSCGSPLCSTRAHNLSGKQFGNLTVESLSTRRNDRGELVWICRCDCGRQRRVKTNNLIKGLVKSCGCQKDFLRSRSLTKPLKEVAANTIWNRYKYGAKKRGISFKLTRQDIESYLFLNCHYCDATPESVFIAENLCGNRKILYNGIDRKDSTKGYTKENCVPCCHTCNTAKSDRPIGEFLKWAKRLVEHQQVLRAP